MAASGTDLFRKKANNFSTTLSGGILAADTSAPLTAVTGLPTDTAIDLVIDRVDTNGTQTPTKREYVKGIVSGSTIASLTRGLGNSTAQAHATGAVVEMVDTSDTHNDLVNALLSVHNQADGSLKTGSVTNAAIASSAVDSTKLAPGAVTTAAIASGTLSSANFSNPYKFDVNMSAGAPSYLAVASNIYIIPFNNKIFDTGSNYSTSSYMFTAPVAGYYSFNGTVVINNGANATYFNVYLYLNGSLYRGVQSMSTSSQTNTTIAISSLMQLTAGGTVDVRVASGVSGIGISSGSWFSGFLVSAT